VGLWFSLVLHVVISPSLVLKTKADSQMWLRIYKK
jgi:hypothetical protein